MTKYNSQLSGIQNEGPSSELGNRDEEYSIRLRATALYGMNLNLSNSSSPWCREQQEKKRIIDISEIIHILRTTKLQQCKDSWYNTKKFCAIGAIMHEKYGWDGNDSLGFKPQTCKKHFHLFSGGILGFI